MSTTKQKNQRKKAAAKSHRDYSSGLRRKSAVFNVDTRSDAKKKRAIFTQLGLRASNRNFVNTSIRDWQLINYQGKTRRFWNGPRDALTIHILKLVVPNIRETIIDNHREYYCDLEDVKF